MQRGLKIALLSVNKHKTPYPVYPLGASYLASYLREKEASWNVKIFDMNIVEYDICVKEFADFNPDYIGISLRNIDDVNFYNQENFIFEYRDLVIDIRKKINSKIILGGAGFSLYPELLYDFINPDYALIGEGEISFYSLISAIENNEDVRNVGGVLYKKDNVNIITERQTPDCNYDFPLKYESDIVPYYWKHSGMMNLQTKRGCPNHCVYCTYPVIEGRNVRTHSIERIIETMKSLKLDHKVDYVFFTDSIFNINNEYNRELAEEMIRQDVRMRWGAYFSPSNADRDLLKLFKQSGLTHIEFGTESLSDPVLEKYGKNFTVSDIISTSKMCSDLEIYFAHFLILAGYGETDETVDETFANSKLIDNTLFFPFVGMRIYPNTRLQKIAVSEGIISEDNSLVNPVYYLSKEVDAETLKLRAKNTGKKWYFPDEDFSEPIMKMRKRNRKGLLWEYLIKY